MNLRKVQIWQLATWAWGALFALIIFALLGFAMAHEAGQHRDRYSPRKADLMAQGANPYVGKTNPKTSQSCCGKNDCWAQNIGSDWHAEMSDDGQNYLITYTFTKSNVPLVYHEKYRDIFGMPQVFEYPVDQVMASWDHRWHVCIWGFSYENGPQPKCLFVPLSF